ncbi:hypothetical protein K438DRAFT_187189 [Mycena galopus ATCC 62051]|nr:hypothetical protein K438DRAFT_187189 [Mycena galopus ATCC 62051]
MKIQIMKPTPRAQGTRPKTSICPHHLSIPESARAAPPPPPSAVHHFPAASVSSERPNKRARLPPPSRNIQASTVDEIQHVENADVLTDFVCRVCGWVQKNERLPDFKRHVKTHQRTFDEDAEKGWRCKGSSSARRPIGRWSGRADLHVLGSRTCRRLHEDFQSPGRAEATPG